jgi:hypothetical protein
MKKTIIAISLCAGFATAPAQADWLDTIKGWLGMESPTAVATAPAQSDVKSGIDINGLVNALSKNLDINAAQAEGGLGALMQYAQTVKPEQFAALSGSIPGLNGVLNAVPDVANMAGEGGIGGLFEMAAQHSESLQAVNTLKQQFEALGLDVGMIPQFIAQAKSYLDTPQGQQVKTMLSDAFAQWM